jgi:hypothetical protein
MCSAPVALHDDADTPICCASWPNYFLGSVSNQTPILFSSFSPHFKCFYYVNWSLLLTTFLSFWPDFVSNRWNKKLSSQLKTTLLVWKLSKLLLLQQSTLPSHKTANYIKYFKTAKNVLQEWVFRGSTKNYKSSNDISNVIYLQYTYCMWYCEKIR